MPINKFQERYKMDNLKYSGVLRMVNCVLRMEDMVFPMEKRSTTLWKCYRWILMYGSTGTIGREATPENFVRAEQPSRLSSIQNIWL